MTRTLALLLAFSTTAALAAPVPDTPDTTWHMLERQQDGGIAAVLHGLSEHECEFAKAWIEGMPATPEEQHGAGMWSYRNPLHAGSAGNPDGVHFPPPPQTVVSAECFQ